MQWDAMGCDNHCAWHVHCFESVHGLADTPPSPSLPPPPTPPSTALVHELVLPSDEGFGTMNKRNSHYKVTNR